LFAPEHKVVEDKDTGIEVGAAFTVMANAAELMQGALGVKLVPHFPVVLQHDVPQFISHTRPIFVPTGTDVWVP
jgi:hypothetical protein